MRYEITGSDGQRLDVDAHDWMMAMAEAIRRWDIEVSGWVCDTAPNGDTQVSDPGTGRSWRVRRLDTPKAPTPTPPGQRTGAPPPVPSRLARGTASPRMGRAGADKPPSSARLARRPPEPPTATPTLPPVNRRAPEPPSAAPSGSAPSERATPQSAVPTMPPSSGASGRATLPPPPPSERATLPPSAVPTMPPSAVPTMPPSAVPTMPPSAPVEADGLEHRIREPLPEDPGPPDDLAERLFDVGFDIADAGDPNASCSKALEIALSMVPCQAGSVLRGTINDAELTFVAVSGPAARELLGRTIPFGQGLAGLAFDLGITVQVVDATQDPRHNARFDAETGFRTRSVLSVPVRSGADFYGCLQLLNPESRRFLPWHVEVAETVARSLAATLSGAS